MLTFLASALGIAKRIPWQAYALIAAAVFLWGYGNHREAQGRKEGRAEIMAKWERANKEAAAKQAASAAQATVERVTETRTIYVKQKARDNAIQATDDGKPSAASNAINCVRLANAGADVSGIPACRGRSGPAEAPAKP